MITHPYANLRSFQSRLSLDFLVKADNVSTDADISRVTNANRIVSVYQKHGNSIHVVREPSSRALEGDGLLTNVPGLTLTIRFADCQGLVIYAPTHNVVGVIHAGWRGIVDGVIPSFFRTLKDTWGIDPANTLVAIGPSLCKRCADFTDPAKEVPSLRAFTEGRRVDLQAAANAQLEELGVPVSSIERSADCTRCHPDTYWTYRGGHREEVKNGFINAFAVTLK